MARKFWMRDGKILVNDSGQPLYCEECPCATTISVCGCDNPLPATLTLQFTVNAYDSSDTLLGTVGPTSVTLTGVEAADDTDTCASDYIFENSFPRWRGTFTCSGTTYHVVFQHFQFTPGVSACLWGFMFRQSTSICASYDFRTIETTSFEEVVANAITDGDLVCDPYSVIYTDALLIPADFRSFDENLFCGLSWNAWSGTDYATITFTLSE